MHGNLATSAMRLYRGAELGRINHSLVLWSKLAGIKLN